MILISSVLCSLEIGTHLSGGVIALKITPEWDKKSKIVLIRKEEDPSERRVLWWNNSKKDGKIDR